MHNGNSIKLLAGNSHMELANAISDQLNQPLVPADVKRFSNGEINVKISQSVRDEDVFIIQSGCFDVNDNMMELLILISACRTASARRITAVIPCYPYARQDKKDKSRAPITAKLVANMLVTAGCDHLITVDLHAGQIQGFFDIPVDNLYSQFVMIRHIKTQIPGWRQAIVVSPDAGGAKRVTTIADKLGLDFALIHRKRAVVAPSAPASVSGAFSNGADEKDDGSTVGEERMELLVGNVKGKTAILVDDMIDTGRTITLATHLLKEAGAEKIFVIASHGIFATTEIEKLADLPIEKLVVTNTVPQTKNVEASKGKLDILDVSPLLAESIRRSHNGESFNILFGEATLAEP